MTRIRMGKPEEFPYTFSKQFQRYKRGFIEGFPNDPFVWLIRPLHPGAIATHTLHTEEDETRLWCIILSPALPNEIAELAAAEEIGHIRMRLEGFPSLDCRAQYDFEPWRILVADVNSLVSDPIVHQRLVDSGFDLEPGYCYDVDKFRERWPGYVEQLPSDVAGPTLSHTYVLLASALLELPEPYRTEIIDVARAESPEILTEAGAIADWIASSDTSTARAYREVVRQLLERLDLQSYFKFRKGL